MRSFSGWLVSAKLACKWAAAAHLIARIHVDAPPEAVVDAAIFLVVAVLGGDGRGTARTGQLATRVLGHCMTVDAARDWSHRAGSWTGTHPCVAIVTIGAAGLREKPRGRGVSPNKLRRPQPERRFVPWCSWALVMRRDTGTGRSQCWRAAAGGQWKECARARKCSE
jgi:hypothetical protein